MSLLKATEKGLLANTPDRLFEVYLSHLLDEIPCCRSEILLFSPKNKLIPVAFAKWDGPEGDQVKRVRTEGWVMENPTHVISRRIRFVPMRPFFSIPLLAPDKIMGFLNVQLDKFKILDPEQVRHLQMMGLHITAKLKEIQLMQEVAHSKAELNDMALHNKEIHQYATSLSKELYAISAISTKINQSMDFEKSLRKSMDTTRKVFGASCILVYINRRDKSKLERVAIEPETDSCHSIPKACLKMIEKKYLQEIQRSIKPIVKDRVEQYFQNARGAKQSLPFRSMIGVPLKSKDDILGAMILLHKNPKPINHAGIRLLSGMANIMGMAIENMKLYRQSEQKKSETAFLFESIVKFNETLNLKAILRLVAEKGVEYSGPESRVYLLSRMKIPFISASYNNETDGGGIHSVYSDTFTSPEIKRIYRLLSDRLKNRSQLIKNTRYLKTYPPEIKSAFQALNICSFIAAPLRLRKNHLGLLLFARGKQAVPFGSHERSFAETLAGAAIMAIENARAYTASQEMSDFLEKKITEKTAQIEHIQARQRARVENRNDMVFQVNLKNKFVFVNKAMEDLTGFSREELCHKDFSANRIIAPEDRERIAEHFRQIMRRDISLVKDAEYRQINRRGEDRIVSLTVYPEFDQNDQVVAVEGVGREITDKRRLEKELKKTKELAMLGEFSGAIAHQMRNPLSNILMGTKRLQKSLGLAVWPSTKEPGNTIRNVSELKTDLQTIDQILADVFSGVYNLNQVVTELLEYTKTLKPSRSMQKVDVVLKDTIQVSLAQISQNNIEIIEDFDSSIPLLPMDAVLMGQAFQNVIHNAVQSMPRGGRLLLSTGLFTERPGNVLISVCDSGIGIPDDDLEKVFRPFYTTKESGVGLGLSLTHRIVEAHSGAIWACRNPCRHLDRFAEGDDSAHDPSQSGTTVHVMLPVAPQASNFLPRES